MDSAVPPEFDCEFWAKPASNITRKAFRLSNAMPSLLKVELLPTCHILNNVYGRSPTLLNVEMYLFPDEKKTERYSKALFDEGQTSFLLNFCNQKSYPIRVCTLILQV